MKVKEKTCENDECKKKFTPKYRSTEKHCSKSCYYADEKTKKKVSMYSAPIKKVSEKRQKENREYLKLRKVFLQDPKNQICPVKGIQTTEVHHKMGRIGYADDWARENGITLFLDVRFWLAVSSPGHKLIELQPEWAKRNNYSLKRL